MSVNDSNHREEDNHEGSHMRKLWERIISQKSNLISAIIVESGEQYYIQD